MCFVYLTLTILWIYVKLIKLLNFISEAGIPQEKAVITGNHRPKHLTVKGMILLT